MKTDTADLQGEPPPAASAPHAAPENPDPAPIRWLRNFVVAVSGTGLLALMFVMAGDVIGRYAFNSPIPGAYELVEYLMAVIVPFCVAYSAAQKCHVGVDILVERLPLKIRIVVDIITQTVTIVLLGFLIWQGWVGFVEAQSSGIRSAVLQIPNSPFLLAVPIGFMAFAIFMLAHLLHKIGRLLKS